MNGNLPPRPLSQDSGWMVCWNYLGAVGQSEHQVTRKDRRTPRGNPPFSCQGPESNISYSNDNIWLTSLDFSFKQLYPVPNNRQDHTVTNRYMGNCNVFFSGWYKVVKVVIWWPYSDNIGDETG